MTAPTPDVAVVITTCNRPAFLPEAIASVLAQRFDGRIELTVVDDGSETSSEPVVRPFVERGDGHVSVGFIYQENQGLAAARNTGVRHTSAPFIAFLDDDDVFEPDKLRLQVNAMRADPEVGLSHTAFRYVDAGGRFIDDGPQRVDNPCVGRCVDVLLNELMVISSTVLVRRATLLAAAAAEPHGLPYDIRWHRSQDYDMALRVARLSKFAYEPTPQLRYRLHGDNIAMSEGNIKRAFGYHCRVQMDFAARYGHEVGVDASEARRRAGAFLYSRAESFFWRRALRTARELCDLAAELGVADGRFAGLRRRAGRPAWLYRLKDGLDRLRGRA